MSEAVEALALGQREGLAVYPVSEMMMASLIPPDQPSRIISSAIISQLRSFHPYCYAPFLPECRYGNFSKPQNVSSGWVAASISLCQVEGATEVSMRLHDAEERQRQAIYKKLDEAALPAQ